MTEEQEQLAIYEAFRDLRVTRDCRFCGKREVTVRGAEAPFLPLSLAPSQDGKPVSVAFVVCHHCGAQGPVAHEWRIPPVKCRESLREAAITAALGAAAVELWNR